jgi:serine/threonine protein kinase
MPDPNEPPPIRDPRLGSLLVSAAGHLDATPTPAPGGTPLGFGPPAAEGEAGTLGPYRVARELGRGGMGAVFQALDTRLDRRLALKVMLPEFAANAEARGRFLREAKAAAKVSHDNVVTVYEADERDGVPYIAMQLLQGYPLDAFLKKKGTPSLRNVVRIAREAALGLAAAHRMGLVHRDVKPPNLWLEAPHGRVKLLDFGLARPESTDHELTRTGAVVGTPAFMSPEQALGVRVDHRTDLFSLGSVLYWLCTGQRPFQGASVMAVLMALGTEEPTPVRELNPAIPPALSELIHRLLAKSPEARPRTAAEVANRLHEILEQPADLSAAGPAAAPSGAAGPGSQAPGDPQAIRSMPVVAIAPAKPPKEEQEEKAGPLRTVISSGVVWEKAGEESRKKARAEVQEDDEAERPDRPRRKRSKARAKKSGNPPLLIGLGAAALVAVAVAATLLVVGGKPKPTDVSQQGADERNG